MRYLDSTGTCAFLVKLNDNIHLNCLPLFWYILVQCLSRSMLNVLETKVNLFQYLYKFLSILFRHDTDIT